MIRVIIRVNKSGTNKKKLTLSVDEEIVDKAKTLGLNLSEITEAVLRGFAFAPDKTENDALYSKYKELCESMLPLLKEYDASVKIAVATAFDDTGNPIYIGDILLNADGTFWSELGEQSFKDIKSIQTYDFLEPKKILANFISSLANVKEQRKGRIQELEMIKKIVLAITDSTRSTKAIPSKTSTRKTTVDKK